MKIPKAYYIPFDNGSSSYANAYGYLNQISNRINVEVLTSSSKVLYLPFGSTVIVEAISSISWHFFLRLDIKVLHAPRGGASLKLGWKTLRKLKWHVRLRLKRRNYVLFRNDYIARYYGFEEEISPNKILIGGEVIDEYFASLPRFDGTVHVSLSECWSGPELVEFFVGLTKNCYFTQKKTQLSVHPSVTLSKCESDILTPYLAEFGDEFIPEIYITDCVSTVFVADSLKVDMMIVKERQTADRALFIPQESIYCFTKAELRDTDFDLGYIGTEYIAGSSPIIRTNTSKTFIDILCKVVS